MLAPPTVAATASHSWREAGAGPLVLFLHPVVATATFWDAQLVALADRFRCVALDAPGYGSSPLAAWSPDALGDWIGNAISTLGEERAHLVGLSLGGMISLYAMARRPESIDRVVLADSSAAFGIDPDAWLADWLGPLANGATVQDLAGAAIDAIVAEPLAEQVRRSVTAGHPAITEAGFRAASTCIAHHDQSAALATLEQQCLVLVGELDGETPVEYSRQLAADLPNAELQVIPGVGHLSSAEAPEQFNSLVRAFLTKAGQ